MNVAVAHQNVQIAKITKAEIAKCLQG